MACLCFCFRVAALLSVAGDYAVIRFGWLRCFPLRVTTLLSCVTRFDFTESCSALFSPYWMLLHNHCSAIAGDFNTVRLRSRNRLLLLKQIFSCKTYCGSFHLVPPLDCNFTYFDRLPCLVLYLWLLIVF